MAKQIGQEVSLMNELFMLYYNQRCPTCGQYDIARAHRKTEAMLLYVLRAGFSFMEN
jgi:predicted RNA-binding Zn-ribbon protein involved in translation (DUF1610 family)